MSKDTLKITKWIVLVSAAVLLCALVAVPAVLTSAQSKKGGSSGKTEQKKPTLRDAVTKKSANEIEAKPGFELVVSGESTFTVRRADTKDIVGSIKCGICPGGRCRARILGGGRCKGCGSDTGRDCVIDPF